jgi:hypothetical protein
MVYVLERLYNMKKQRTNEDFINEVYNLVGDEYIFLEEFINVDTKIKVKHNKCGRIYKTTPNSFLSAKRRCALCMKKMKKTTKIYKSEVREKVKDEYIVLGKYINNSTKIKMKHVKCGYIWKVTPSSFLNKGRRCPKCNQNFKLTQKEVNERVNIVGSGEYKLLSKYIHINKKIKLKHLKCGYIWNVRANCFLNMGQRCPKCKNSHGENRIYKWLKNNFNGKIKRNFILKECRNINPLPFDFYIENKNFKALIEYDGIQHFKPTFGSNLHEKKLKLKLQIKNDKIKNKFCNEKNINLIRIKYTDFKNIEKILRKLLL